MLPVFLLPLTCLLLASCSGGRSAQKPPDTPRVPVSSTYHGVQVTEDYRWLEDFDDPEVKAWSDAQNAITRRYLDGLADQQAIYERVKELYGGTSVDYTKLCYAGNKLFALKSDPSREQPLLVALGSADNPAGEKTILDLNTLSAQATVRADFFVPSPDGRLVAVSLSDKGGEIGDVYVYDVATGQRLSDHLPGVNAPTAGGSVAWKADGSGFFYTRYPRPGERPAEDMLFYQQVYYHTLGTPTNEDTYCIGQELPRIAEIALDVSSDGAYFLATVSNGDGGEYAHYLFGPSGKWAQITKFEDSIPSATFGANNSLYLTSLKGTPRGSILRLPPGVTSLSEAKQVIVESDVTIEQFLATDSLLYTVDMAGGPNQIRIFALSGEPMGSIPTPPVSSVGNIVPVGDGQILYRNYSYVSPPAWYRYDPKSGQSNRTQLCQTAAATFDDIEVTREFSTSKDGTQVPITILRPHSITMNAETPTLLYGYGGYGLSQSPWFDVGLRIWFDQGGVYVVANIRGGGEYGEEWHRAGNLLNKQNVFDDFASCAQYLIDKGYTSPARLAIRGGSNGGLLMGAALTRHPDLFRAVVSRAGVYDMLRSELEPNGQYNVTEYGSVTDPDQFRALYAYSPYHHVIDGAKYPAMLFYTGLNDGRVDPYQSRKMIARVQAANASGLPALLRTSTTSGHSSGNALSERVAIEADVYAFLLDQLGVQFRK